jgi:hypothetical protein
METTTYRPSGRSRAFDLDQSATDPQITSYLRARAERIDLAPHDPMPLFLSDPESEPDPREFVAMRPKSRVAARLVAAVLAAATIAVVVVLFQPHIGRLAPADAWAWMAAAATRQAAPAPANPPPARQIPLKDPARMSNPTLASAGAKDIPAPMPSREAIAIAYQSALKAQTPAPEPVAESSAPAKPVRMLDADTLAGLMTRAKSLMAIGDIAAARLLLERAANAPDPTAAFVLAETYDPAVLGTSDQRSITADADLAHDWYEKAAQLGSAEAKQRLTQLQN